MMDSEGVQYEIVDSSVVKSRKGKKREDSAKPIIHEKDIAAFQRNAGMLKILGLFDALEEIRIQMITEEDNKRLWKLQTRLAIFQKYLDLYGTAGKIAQAQSMIDLSDSKVTEVKLSLARSEEEK